MPSAQHLLSPEQLLSGWTPRRVGRRVVVLPEATSTNSVALEMAAQPDADGLAVFAEYQTGGRGRLGRTWASPRGASVLCSVALLSSEIGQPDASPHVLTPDPGTLTLLAAVAGCEAIRQTTEVVPTIKWPNDLQVAGRKVAGILIESRPAPGGRIWVVGIGINCLQHEGHFPPELRAQATSLEIESHQPVDRAGLARTLLQRLDAWLAPAAGGSCRHTGETPVPHNEVTARHAEAVHRAWLEHAEPIGQRVRLRREGREFGGHVLAVDPSGGLIVQCDEGGREWFDPLLTTLLSAGPTADMRNGQTS
jgi:BirA family transcriptional regulator, biotin operon repressor / biotin---[acetyl-CoA-carboxylase] ligase